MPERLAYDEAMQFSRIRLKVQDPELKQGQVEIVTIPAIANATKTAHPDIEYMTDCIRFSFARPSLGA